MTAPGTDLPVDVALHETARPLVSFACRRSSLTSHPTEDIAWTRRQRAGRRPQYFRPESLVFGFAFEQPLAFQATSDALDVQTQGRLNDGYSEI
jgi:hypothetical protein